MLEEHGKEDPKETVLGAMTQPCLTPLHNVKWLCSDAVELHCPLHVGEEGLDEALQLLLFWGDPIFGGS